MKILVTGFFDLLHPGHILFLKKASELGDLYVSIGNDKNLRMQKGKLPIYTEQERLDMIKSIRYVKEAMIADGVSYYDFEEAIKVFKPDVFCINDDGDNDEKKRVCKKYNVDYRVLMIRGENLWSSTKLRGLINDTL